jgi:hypothetical protein
MAAVDMRTVRRYWLHKTGRRQEAIKQNVHNALDAQMRVPRPISVAEYPEKFPLAE